MINKTQRQSFGAVRYDGGAKNLKGVRTSIDKALAAHPKVAGKYHFFVQDKAKYSRKGTVSLNVIEQSKSKVANWLFGKFPRSTVVAHRLLKRPSSRVVMIGLMKSENLTSRVADAIERKVPFVKADNLKKVTSDVIEGLSLGTLSMFGRNLHLGKETFTSEDAGIIISKGVTNLRSKEPKSETLYTVGWKYLKLLRASLKRRMDFEDVDTSALDRNTESIAQMRARVIEMARKIPAFSNPITFPNVDTSTARRQRAFAEGLLKQVQDPSYAHGS